MNVVESSALLALVDQGMTLLQSLQQAGDSLQSLEVAVGDALDHGLFPARGPQKSLSEACRDSCTRIFVISEIRSLVVALVLPQGIQFALAARRVFLPSFLVVNLIVCADGIPKVSATLRNGILGEVCSAFAFNVEQKVTPSI